MAYNFLDNIELSSKKFLDYRMGKWGTLEELEAQTDIYMPDGYRTYLYTDKKWMQLSCTDPTDPSTYEWSEIKSSVDPATIEKLGGVIVGDGLEITEDGTLSVAAIKIEEEELEDGIKVKTEKIGSITITITTSPDGTSTTVINNGSSTTTIVKDKDGNPVYKKVDDVITGGKETITTHTEDTDDDGNTIIKDIEIENTPGGQRVKETTITTAPDGTSKEVVKEVHGGNNVNKGLATGTKKVIEKDTEGTVIKTTEEPIMTDDGKNNLVKKSDVDDLMGFIDNLW